MKLLAGILLLFLMPLHAMECDVAKYGDQEKGVEKTAEIQEGPCDRYYYHLYPQHNAVRSLVELCVGCIANHIKDNVDPKKPCASKEFIEQEIFPVLRKNNISPNCLLLYWKTHIQPLWRQRAKTIVTNKVQEFVCGKFLILLEAGIDRVAIIDLTSNIPVVSYRDISSLFSTDIDANDVRIAASFNNELLAIANDHEVVLLSTEHPFPLMCQRNLKGKITSLDFSPEGNLFVGMMDGNIIKLFIKGNIIEQHDEWIWEIAKGKEIKLLRCSPDGSFIIIYVDDKAYRISNTHEKEIHAIELPDSLFSCRTIIISPDSNLIFFKDNAKGGWCYNVTTRAISYVLGDIEAITPENKFVDLHLYLHDCNGRIKRRFGGENSITCGQSYRNSVPFYAYCAHTSLYKGEKLKRYETLYDPSLDQILYQLALESAFKRYHDYYLSMLLGHSLFYTFSNGARDLLNDRYARRFGVEWWFVKRYVRPLLASNQSIESVVRDEFLDGYGNAAKELIFWKINKAIENWFVQKYESCGSIEQKLLLYKNFAVSYRIYCSSDTPSHYFRKLIDSAYRTNNLVALKKIRESGIGDAFRNVGDVFENESSFLNIQKCINRIKCNLDKISICSMIALKGFLLDPDMKERYGSKMTEKIKKAAKQRVEVLVDEAAQVSTAQAQEILTCDIIRALFSQEEFELLSQNVEKVEVQKKISDFTDIDTCVDFANRLPRMRFDSIIKSALRDNLSAKIGALYNQKLDVIAALYLQTRNRDHVYRGFDDLTRLEETTVPIRDLFSWDAVKDHFSATQMQLLALGTKLRQQDTYVWNFANKEMKQLNIHL